MSWLYYARQWNQACKGTQNVVMLVADGMPKDAGQFACGIFLNSSWTGDKGDAVSLCFVSPPFTLSR